MTTQLDSTGRIRPVTFMGNLAVILMTAFVAMYILDLAVLMHLPEVSRWQPALIFYGIAMLVCGVAAGATGLVAVILVHERSWLVWLTILPLVFAFFLLLGEFLGPPH